MKRISKHSFYLLLLLLLAVSCAPEDSSSGKPTLTASSNTSLSATYDTSKSLTFTFSSSDAWTVDASDEEMSVSPSSGKAGTTMLTVKLKNYNCTNVNYDYFFTINSQNSYGSESLQVKITQPPVFTLEKTYFEADPEGDTLRVAFNTDGNLSNGFYVYYGQTGDAQDMVPKKNSSRAESKYNYEAKLIITANTEGRQRNGYFAFGLDTSAKQLSTMFQVSQLPSSVECSTDTITNDGTVRQLQHHSIGNGVPLVIMGDGFIDREVNDGTYDEAMKKAYEYFFSINPTDKLKDYFDVYAVTAVSYNNIFSSTTRTAFSSVFKGGNSTEVVGNNDKVKEYATKAISKNSLNDAVIIVVLNDTRQAGTCVLYTGTSKTDIPTGVSIAYLPMTEYSEATESGFEQILHHEAVGHGFAKLADEYNNEENGTITDEAKERLEQNWNVGFCRNLSTSDDVTKTFWSDLAADSRYSSENLGCYEGGYTYNKGVWRATDENIMRHNIGGFNVHQRRLIYNRCMRIANGTSWNPSYEKFVQFDQIPSTLQSAKGRATSSQKKPLFFLPPTSPKIIFQE